MGPDRTDLPGYEIQEVLGRGGFATVYRARQLAVGREVALKIDSRVLSTPRDRQRFLREVTAAGQLSGHPHVVPVYDAGVLAGHLPTAMLFVRNPTGVSHAPGEAASDADCAAGVDALAAVLRDLAC